jgi:uncharacterized repeat protein (TIGR02543 family)
MRRAAVWGVLTLALALVLGVGSASGRVATITTLTVQVIGEGQVTSDPSGISCGRGNYDCYAAFSDTGSTTVDLKATPDDNWTFESWGAPYDTNICGPGHHCVITLDGNPHVITARFKGGSTRTKTLTVKYEGQGTVTGGEINCGATSPGPTAFTPCTWSVLTGSTLTVHEAPDATASPAWVFAGWTGSACSKQVDDACTMKMDESQQITATWAQPTDVSTLSITANGSGTVTGTGFTCHGPGSCTESEPKDSTVALYANPDSGYVFTGWSGDCLGAGVVCNLTMDFDRTVVANFARAVNLTVAVSGNGNVSGGAGKINCGNGGVICSANFSQNATVTLIATPVLGATFTGWTGACHGRATSCTVLMSQSRSVTATFGTAVGGFLLTVTVWAPGSVNGPGIKCGNGATTCSATPAPNANVTLTATPAAGTIFSSWGGACFAVTVPTCTVQMTAARSVTAIFTTGGGGGPVGGTVPLSVSVVGSGTVSGGGIQCGNGSGGCSVNVPVGSAVTLTAAPNAGASFTSWGGAACHNITGPTCTVLMTSAQVVSAIFSTAAPGTLAITVQGRGTVSAPLGKCIGFSATRTCIQKYKAGRTVTLTTTAGAGNTFAGWDGACLSAAKKVNCTLTLSTAKSVTARFVPGGGAVTPPVLTSLAPPVVSHTAAGFRVTLRFNSTRAGIARVFGLRAGRVGARVTFRIGAGPARIGPFTVAQPGLYTFQVRLGTASLQWRVCLGRCGAAAPPPPFILIGKPPTVARAGGAWSVTLHVRSNQISVARVRAVRGGKVLVDQQFLAKKGDISTGLFLLGPGSYTVRLNATDAYGRTRNLTWPVALAF